MRCRGGVNEMGKVEQHGPFGLFLVPWKRLSAKSAAYFEGEIRRELGKGHPLYGRNCRAVSVTVESDDVLFYLDDTTVAQVHLTFTPNPPERPGWPRFKMFGSLGDWMIQVMIEDHVDHCCLN
jgi:hypothetical protein